MSSEKLGAGIEITTDWEESMFLYQRLVEKDKVKSIRAFLADKGDTMSKDSNEYATVMAEIQTLINSTDPPLLKVNPKHTYDFYVLGGVVTDQLNNYMRQTEIDYADMHNRYWAEHLLDFRRLVGNSSIMDLKTSLNGSTPPAFMIEKSSTRMLWVILTMVSSVDTAIFLKQFLWLVQDMLRSAQVHPIGIFGLLLAMIPETAIA